MNTSPGHAEMHFLISAANVVLVLLLTPLVMPACWIVPLNFGLSWLIWPLYRRWKQRPFDPAVWKDNPPSILGAYTTKEIAESDPTGEKNLPGRRGYHERDARFWMVDDLIRQLPGKTREEVLELLGEPDMPSPSRKLLEDNPHSWQLVYALTPEGLFGRRELLIRLNEQGRVKEAKVGRSAT
jgi:hypothetical protein